MTRVLVAGVGNVFLSDDGFGPEVLRHMTGRQEPDGVKVVDFGIRGVHLAYELLDGYDVLVVVDAAPRGLAPGTLSVLEVDPAAHSPLAEDGPLLDAHGMEPAAILRSLGSLGGQVARVLVLACEPSDLDEGMGLTPAVAAAVPAAVQTLHRLILDLAGNAPVPTLKEVSP
ncbi:MAG: hydrogenase maturation protease [Sporichthyaceae bacterium]